MSLKILFHGKISLQFFSMLFSVGYFKKDIEDIQDIWKNTRNQEIGDIFTSPNTYLQKLDVYLKNSWKKTFKNLSLSNCDLWSLQNRHSWKQENLTNLSTKEKNLLLRLKILFMKSRYICKTSIVENIIEKVLLLICDIW